MIRGRGYELISLTEALSDEAYQLEDGYVGAERDLVDSSLGHGKGNEGGVGAGSSGVGD